MSCVDELNQCPCDKIDANCVDAFIDAHLQPEDPSNLVIESSWGETEVDLTPAVKDAETITHLFLTPENNPTALQYNREDYMREGAEGDGIDCIEGDDLSRIISMRYLKDVDQSKPPKGGDVYMFNETTNQFEPFALQEFVDKTNTAIANLNKQVNQLQQDVSALQNIVNSILQTIAKPAYVPKNARLVWGTTNTMWQQDPLMFGIYSHDPRNNVTGDNRFK